MCRTPVIGSTIVVGLAIILPVCRVFAASWSVTPSLLLRETYTDNVALAPFGLEEEEYITEINPGISLAGVAPRARANVDYRMQNLFYGKEHGRNTTNHSLRARANAELIEEHFFLDGNASVSRTLISREDGVPLDNLNLLNRTDVYTYGVSPYYKQRIGNIADALVRYRYSTVRYGEGPSDSDSESVDFSLTDGRRFTRLSWKLHYKTEHINRELAADITHESGFAEVSYQLTRSLSALAQGGYEWHDLPIEGETEHGTYWEDGTYWAVGAAWQPNRKLRLQALKGDRYKTGSITWTPTIRTSLQANWRELEVGLNPGTVWSGEFSLRTRRTNWRASYLEDTTTVQEIQLINRTFIDPVTGDEVMNPQPGDIVEVLPDGYYVLVPSGIPLNDFLNAVFGVPFALTDDVFIRKRAQASVGVQTGKSSIIFLIFNERREYEGREYDDIVHGVTASWNWRFAARTIFTLGTGWQHTDFRPSDREADYWHLDTSVNRKLGRKSDTSIGYRYTTRDSSGDNRDYEENRVYAQIYMRF